MKIQQADDCREAVYSNDYYDLILDYVSGYPRGETECYQRVSDQYDIAYFAREGIPALNLQDYPYQTIPKCFGLTDLSALESSGILRLQNPAGLDLMGQGILVGFVDTGMIIRTLLFRIWMEVRGLWGSGIRPSRTELRRRGFIMVSSLTGQ